MIDTLLDVLFGVVFMCRHARVTRPFTIHEQTYKVCLECGKQIPYSTATMKPLTQREIRRRKMGEVKIMPNRTALAEERKLAQ